MKQTIRQNTFETNSSSTHNMVVIPESKLEAWDNNELYYVRHVWSKEVKEFVEKNKGRSLYTKQELIDSGMFNDMPKREDFKTKHEFEDAIEEYFNDSDFVTADKWHQELEEDEHIYVTESGERLHIICQYGYDG